MEAQDINDKENNKSGQNGSDPFQPKGPRDGLDNTGTQGKDSLLDDGYTGSTGKPTEGKHGDQTGSSSEDFTERPIDTINKEDEDKALDSGI
jgi:hypothetical protein